MTTTVAMAVNELKLRTLGTLQSKRHIIPFNANLVIFGHLTYSKVDNILSDTGQRLPGHLHEPIMLIGTDKSFAPGLAFYFK